MAQDRSTKIISMMKWIRTSRLSIKNAFSLGGRADRGNAAPEGNRKRRFQRRVRVLNDCGRKSSEEGWGEEATWKRKFKLPSRKAGPLKSSR